MKICVHLWLLSLLLAGNAFAQVATSLTGRQIMAVGQGTSNYVLTARGGTNTPSWQIGNTNTGAATNIPSLTVGPGLAVATNGSPATNYNITLPNAPLTNAAVFQPATTILSNITSPPLTNAAAFQPAAAILSNITSPPLTNAAVFQPATTILSNVTYLPQPASTLLSNITSAPLTNSAEFQPATTILSNITSAPLLNAALFQPATAILSNVTYLPQPASTLLSNITSPPLTNAAVFQPATAILSNVTYLPQPASTVLSNVAAAAFQPATTILSNILNAPVTNNNAALVTFQNSLDVFGQVYLSGSTANGFSTSGASFAGGDFVINSDGTITDAIGGVSTNKFSVNSAAGVTASSLALNSGAASISGTGAVTAATYTGSASGLTGYPHGSASAFGVFEVDGTTVVQTNGVLSAIGGDGGGSGGGNFQPATTILSNVTYLPQPASTLLSNITSPPLTNAAVFQPATAILSNVTYLPQPASTLLSNITSPPLTNAAVFQPASAILSNVTYLPQPASTLLSNITSPPLTNAAVYQPATTILSNIAYPPLTNNNAAAVTLATNLLVKGTNISSGPLVASNSITALGGETILAPAAGGTALTVTGDAPDSDDSIASFFAFTGGNSVVIDNNADLNVTGGSFFASSLSTTPINPTNMIGTIPYARLPSGVVTNTNAAPVVNLTLQSGTYTGTNNWTGDLAFPAALNAGLVAGDNYDIVTGTNVYIRVEGPSAAFALDGFAGGRSGRTIIIRNDTIYPMTIRNQSGGNSFLVDAILTGSGADLVLSNTPAIATLIYSAVSSRWEVQSQNGFPLLPVNLPGVAANQLFVATNGSDATGQRGTFAPFLTLSNAVYHAQYGDDIAVEVGVYPMLTNLAKNGVTWHFAGSQCVISNFADCVLNPSSTNAMFTDSYGATNFSVYGFPTLIYNTGTNFILPLNSHQNPTAVGASNCTSVVIFNTPWTVSTLQFADIQYSSYQSSLGNYPVLALNTFSNVYLTVNTMELETLGLSYNVNTTGSHNNSYSDAGLIGLTWGIGNLYFTATKISPFDIYGICCSEGIGTSPPYTNNGYFNVTELDAKIYVSASDNTYRSWFNLNWLNCSNSVGGYCASFYGGFNYLTAQKVSDSVVGCLDVESGGSLWANVEKLESPSGFINTVATTNAHGGSSAIWAVINNYAGMATPAAGITLGGPTNFIYGAENLGWTNLTIASSGITNTAPIPGTAVVTATATTFWVSNYYGAAIATNATFTGTIAMPLGVGGVIHAASGLSGYVYFK